MSEETEDVPETGTDAGSPAEPAEGRTPAPETEAQLSARAPTSAAQAASRARRIGGRPLPGPRPAAEATGAARRPSPSSRPPSAEEKPDTSGRRRLRPGGPRPRGAGSATPKRARQPLDPETFRRRVARTGTVLVVLSSVAVAALLGFGLWFSHGVWWAKSSLDARRNEVRSQVLAAAKTCTAAVLSFDYRSLDNSEQAGKNCTTGQLAKDYTTLMDQTVKKIAPQTKTVQVFQTIKAGITSVSPDGKQWVVLVYGQESVTNTSTQSGSASPSASPSPSASRSSSASAGPSASPSGSSSPATPTSAPRLDISTASVTLNQVNGRWLLSNVTTTS